MTKWKVVAQKSHIICDEQPQTINKYIFDVNGNQTGKPTFL